MGGEDPSSWDPNAMPDERVMHFWDEQKALGYWFPQQDAYAHLRLGPLAWDIYFLYGADTVWGDEAPPFVSSGGTIMSTREKLREALGPLLHAD